MNLNDPISGEAVERLMLAMPSSTTNDWSGIGDDDLSLIYHSFSDAPYGGETAIVDLNGPMWTRWTTLLDEIGAEIDGRARMVHTQVHTRTLKVVD